MLSSIHPLGEAGRGNRYRVTAVAFAVGSTVGGAVTGALLGAAGAATGILFAPELTAPVALPVAVLVVAAALAGAARFGVHPPSLPRQVNENWLVEFRGWVYGAGFGFQLGAAVVTYIRSTAVWVWLVTALLLGLIGAPLASVAVGATFGAVRGGSIFATRDVRSTEELIGFHRRLQARR